MDLAPGTQVGPYSVESLLGEGGMGRVYKASGPGGAVAVKIVKEEMAADETFRKRFIREAHMAQRIDHPYVLKVLETGEHEGIPWMSQPYVGGGSLEDRLLKHGALDLHLTVGICKQVAEGLDVLHENGLIHRDLKPGNILIDEAGNPFIGDFGLAKDQEHRGTVLTRPGQALGSVDYMAPEQIRGDPVSGQTDIYALACMLFELLTGQPPFADRVGTRIMWAHLQDPPPNPAEVKPTVPAAVGEALLRGMEKEPADRPPTASAFIALVEEAAGPAPDADSPTVIPD